MYKVGQINLLGEGGKCGQCFSETGESEEQKWGKRVEDSSAESLPPSLIIIHITSASTSCGFDDAW